MDGIELWQWIIHDNLSYLTKLPGAIVTLAVGYAGLTVLRRLIRASAFYARLDESVLAMILSIVTLLGWMVLLAAALGAMDLGELSIALGGSIALVGVALATGLRSIAQDLFAGLFLLADEYFKVGARVRAAGVKGTVTELGVRKTRIRDGAGNIHTVPNRTVDHNTYIVYGKTPPKSNRRRGRVGRAGSEA